MFKNPTLVDGNFYDAVIPGYLEPEMFPLQEKKEDYYLYVGRMVDRKGLVVAQHVCKELGLKLSLITNYLTGRSLMARLLKN